MRDAFINDVSKGYGGKLSAFHPVQATRPKSGKTLDWALADAGYGAKVEPSLVDSGSKKSNAKVTASSKDEDEDFMPEVTSTSKVSNGPFCRRQTFGDKPK
jgi:hypothetical protein